MNPSNNFRRSIFSAMRQAMLFSVGSMLILQEKMAEFVEHAMERGQEAQEEGTKMVQEMRAERKKKEPETMDALDTRINKALERLNVPSRKDIEELNNYINELSQHIDELESAS